MEDLLLFFLLDDHESLLVEILNRLTDLVVLGQWTQLDAADSLAVLEQAGEHNPLPLLFEKFEVSLLLADLLNEFSEYLLFLVHR